MTKENSKNKMLMITVKRVGTVGIDNKLKKTYFFLFFIVTSRVADPDPDPEPSLFTGSGSYLPWLCKGVDRNKFKVQVNFSNFLFVKINIKILKKSEEYEICLQHTVTYR